MDGRLRYGGSITSERPELSTTHSLYTYLLSSYMALERRERYEIEDFSIQLWPGSAAKIELLLDKIRTAVWHPHSTNVKIISNKALVYLI